ncbi:MAG: hypothetical protein RMJ98_22955 [Myxococcales bacterium]|nr:hypothetical protein [Polyangiaceae bacterium]MDW8252166.1 hypothetical protein [Myxococcales bacterium]
MRISFGAPLLTAFILFLSVSASATEPSHPLDLRRLFFDGVLSPGYPARHSTSTARPIPLASEESFTVLSILVNPAFFPLGVWSVRAELAPLRYISGLAEYSRIQNFDVPGLKGKSHLDGNALDLGFHVWPQGKGVHGVYLGPRYSFGSGEDRTGYGEGDLSGWGADLGYQWVAGLFSFNLGAGLGQATARIRPTEALRTREDIPESLRQTEARATFLRPYLTVGLGLSF